MARAGASSAQGRSFDCDRKKAAGTLPVHLVTLDIQLTSSTGRVDTRTGKKRSIFPSLLRSRRQYKGCVRVCHQASKPTAAHYGVPAICPAYLQYHPHTGGTKDSSLERTPAEARMLLLLKPADSLKMPRTGRGCQTLLSAVTPACLLCDCCPCILQG